MASSTKTSPAKVGVEAKNELFRPSKVRKTKIREASVISVSTLDNNFPTLVTSADKPSLFLKSLDPLALATAAEISMGLKSLVL